MTAQPIIDAHRNHLVVDSDDGLVVLDTAQGAIVWLWPDDALALAEQLTLAALDVVRTRGAVGV